VDAACRVWAEDCGDGVELHGIVKQVDRDP